MTAVHRPQISFGAWMPVARDQKISYRYLSPQTGRSVSSGGTHWHVVKVWLAETAIWTGQEIFTVFGGVGEQRWQRLVTVSQEEADAFFREAIEAKSGFMLRNVYRRACARRADRLGEPPVTDEPIEEILR